VNYICRSIDRIIKCIKYIQVILYQYGTISKSQIRCYDIIKSKRIHIVIGIKGNKVLIIFPRVDYTYGFAINQ